MRRSNSCQCNHFDRDGGGLAVQDAIHESAHLRRRGVRFGRGRVALSAKVTRHCQRELGRTCQRKLDGCLG